MRYITTVIVILLMFVPASGSGRSRLLVLGDSLTGGLYASSESLAFRHVLAEMLHADLAHCNGRNVQNLTACLEKYQDWQPDIVVIEIGLNDVSNYGGTALSLPEWKTEYSALTDGIQQSGARVVLTTMFNGRLSESSTAYDAYNQHIRDTAVSSGAILADVWTATANCGECVSKPGEASAFPPFRGDNFHPSDYGHRLIAETIYQAMQGKLYFPVVTK